MTDSGGVNASAAFQLTINIAKLAITTSTPLPSGKVNANYSQTIAATGGMPPYTWGSNNNTPGLTLSSAGVLSGTPTTTGTYSFTIQVSDSAAAVASVLFQLTVDSPSLTVTTSTLAAGQVGAAYSASLSGQRGHGPLFMVRWRRRTGIVAQLLGLVERNSRQHGRLQSSRASGGQDRRDCICRSSISRESERSIDHHTVAPGTGQGE